MFVSPVPAVRRSATGWNTFRGEPISASALSKSLRFYTIEVAVHDRYQLMCSSKFLTRFWLRTSLFIKPLFTAEDEPHARRGCLSLGLNARWAKRNGQAIVRALDAIESFSKFGLLCSYDD